MRSLSETERSALLQLARDSIKEAVCHGDLLVPIPGDGIFSERCGVFVTLHVLQRLRGCIGVIEGEEPLGSSIVRCAASAALYDPRFPRLLEPELPNLQIEISLLSAPAPILPGEIELGRHGLLVSQGRQRGVLLPQVATEHGLTVEQFLAETCRKAQLSTDAWHQPESKICGFTCQVFSDTTVARSSS
jgi:AmmeMemoRadiSam system protein A